MAAGEKRWWGGKSEYPWEQEALDYIRAKLPDREPYRAWTTFTFVSDSGHVREVDLLVATPAGLFLIEIKSHRGRLTNKGSSWTFQGSRESTIENPLHLTDLKAKQLKSSCSGQGPSSTSAASGSRSSDRRCSCPTGTFVANSTTCSGPVSTCAIRRTVRTRMAWRGSGGTC